MTDLVVWRLHGVDPKLGRFSYSDYAIIVGGVIGVTKLILKHQERIVMIERGIHPDAPGVQQR